MRCVQITGPDDRMDCRHLFHDPINPLPRKCLKCGFPDLDRIPQPYFLVKSRTMSPNELALGENGNFFVRQRLRRLFEVVAPGQCTYFPTCYKGTSQETPWLLTVPNHQVVTARVKPSIRRCDACGEPRSAHPGTQFSEYLFGKPCRGQPLAEGWTSESEYEVLKSSTWGSSEKGWDRWIFRDCFMSVRLLHLLKTIKAKGFSETTLGKPTAPDEDESAWIKDKLWAFQANGIPLHSEGTFADEDARWFRDYIKRHSGNVADVEAIGKRLKFKLPKSYIDFVTKVGAMSFQNVDEQEGFTAHILTPDELDDEGYRAGALESDDEETNAVDGVMFAKTEHGDCFCFDVQKGKKDFPVFLYKHEGNYFEPYAENFAACIKRFAGGSDR
jgi:hypothetical protein